MAGWWLSTINSQPSTLFSGDNSAVAPPVPIPNTAVKRCSPDGSTAIGRARVGRRQNRAPAGQMICGCFFGVAYSSGEHAVLGSRREDGQAREGSERSVWKHASLRTSPEPRHLFQVTGAFSFLGRARFARLTAGHRVLVNAPSRSRTSRKSNLASRNRIDP